MSAPRVGDRVRLTVEGLATAADAEHVAIGAHWVYYFEHGDDVQVSVEVIAPAEPLWVVGDLVWSSRNGHTFRYEGDGRWRLTSNGYFDGRMYDADRVSAAWAAGRLTVLLHDGKPA